MVLVVEQAGRARSLGHVVDQRTGVADVIGIGVVRIDLVFAKRFLAAVVGSLLEQALVGRQQRRHPAAALLAAGGDDVLHVLQRRITLLLPVGIAVADLDQRVAIAGFGRGHAVIEGIDRLLVASRQRERVAVREQQDEDTGQRRKAPGNRNQGFHRDGDCKRKPQGRPARASAATDAITLPQSRQARVSQGS